jgi:RsiW-degrading membrane proteinase PrsW (M82 family)
MNLNTQLKRVLYGSPLHKTGGKVALAAILLALFAFAFPTFVYYYTAQPLQFLAMLPFGFLIYLPTILFLFWLDRREHEPAPLYWGVVFALILFFCMVSAKATYFLIDAFQVPFFIPVGPSEELWKVAPLLLLVIFTRPAVNGTRDGFIYGALGGLGLPSWNWRPVLRYPISQKQVGATSGGISLENRTFLAQMCILSGARCLARRSDMGSVRIAAG